MTYDSATRKATMKVKINRLQDLGNNRRGLRAHIRISYRNQPFTRNEVSTQLASQGIIGDATTQTFVNTAQVTMDEGLASEQVLAERNWNVRFRVFERKSETPSGYGRTGNLWQNTRAERVYVYNPVSDEIQTRSAETWPNVLGVAYHVSAWNTNNGSYYNTPTGGITSAVSKITFNDLDSRLYYNNFVISGQSEAVMNKFNAVSNVLYGVLEDGSKEVIATNLKASTSDQLTNIGDTSRKYSYLSLEFPDKPLILDNQTVAFRIDALPIEAERDKFRNFEYTNAQTYEMKSVVTYANINLYLNTVLDNGVWKFASSGTVPEGATIDPTTGVVTLPKSSLVGGLGATTTNTTSKHRSYTAGAILDGSYIMQPTITYKDNFDTEIYLPDDDRVTYTETVFSHVENGSVTVITQKGDNGWEITSGATDGVSVDATTGKITIDNSIIVQDSTIRSIAKASSTSTNSWMAYSRTPYENDTEGRVIRPTSPVFTISDDTVTIAPFADGRTNSMNVTYSVNNAADLASLNYGIANETDYRENWVRIEFPWIRARLENGTNSTVYYSSAPGANYRELYTRGLFGGSWPTGNFESQFKAITLLPSGVNFVRDGGVINNRNATNYSDAPEVIENFRNTGRTAVIYTYDLTKKSTEDDATYLNGGYVGRKFTVDVTALANDGDNVVDHYLIWDKENIIRPNHNTYTDTLDLDGDGSTTEQFIHTTNILTLVLPNEVSSKKQVSLDKQNWVINVPPQDIGGPVYYRLNVVNNTIRALPNFKLLDVLPAIGDHKIVENEDGEYLSRNTQLLTPMVESIESVPENASLLTKWNFYYSTDAQGATTNDMLAATWVTADEITDFSQVKMIRAELKSGQTFASKEELNIIIHAQIPYDKSLENGLISVNSMAISTLGDTYAESNEVTASNIKYEVNGIAFFDINKDSKLDANEPVLKGYLATLLDANGEPYVDPGTQKVITAVTNSKGYYHMNVYERGSYSVRFTKIEDDETISSTYKVDSTDENNQPIKVEKAGTTVQKDGLVGNDATQDATEVSYATTSLFALNPVTTVGTRNLGLVSNKGGIVVMKTNEDGDMLPGSTFTVSQNGTVLDTLTTDEEGSLVFTGLDFGAYQITETATTDPYALNSTPINVTISDDVPYYTVNFTNNFKRSNLKVVKKDKLNGELLAGITFVLENTSGEGVDKDGKTTDTPYTVVTDENGVALFEGVRYGSYIVHETSTIASHLLATDGVKLNATVSNDNEIVLVVDESNEAVYNTPKLATVIVKKVDSVSNDPIQGVTFELFDTNNKYNYKVVTDEDGVATFKDVRYGTYTLKETKTHDWYVLNDTFEKTIEVTENGQVINVGTVENTLIKGTVTFKKIDAEEQFIMPNVSFKLENTKTYDKSTVVESILRQNAGTTVTYDDGTQYVYTISEETDDTITIHSVYRAKSNDEGIVTFSNVIYGDYKLTETETLEGYVLSDKEINVSISESGQTVTLDDFTNERIKGSVVLYKKDSETLKAVPNIKFVLKKYDSTTDTDIAITDEELEEYNTFSKTLYEQGEYEAVSDNDGKIIFEDVLYGVYKLYEVETTPNYLLNKEVRTLRIKENGEVIEMADYLNVAVKGTVTFRKISNIGENVAGAVFTLSQYGIVKYKAVSDGAGMVEFKDVLYGPYTIAEQSAPNGYIKSNQTVDIFLKTHKEIIQVNPFVNVKIIPPVQEIPNTGNNENVMTYVFILICGSFMLALSRKIKE